MLLEPSHDSGRRLISLTPLIDVVFILLLFFMLTSQFDRPRALIMDVPAARSTSDTNNTERVAIELSASGESEAAPELERTLYVDSQRAVWLGEQQWPVSELTIALRNSVPIPTAQASAQNRIALRTDAALTVDQLRPIIDAMRDDGIEQIELSTTAAPATAQ